MNQIEEFVHDWIGYVGRDVHDMSRAINADKDAKGQVETIAYHFARMVLWNLDKVTFDENTNAHVRYAAAQGFVQAATEHLATIDPDDLQIERERIN